jgi:hypothetical protein
MIAMIMIAEPLIFAIVEWGCSREGDTHSQGSDVNDTQYAAAAVMLPTTSQRLHLCQVPLDRQFFSQPVA